MMSCLLPGFWKDHMPYAQEFYNRGGTKTSFEAWAAAWRSTQQSHTMRQAHPAQNLHQILVRLGSFGGMTTSGCEQGFSKLKQVLFAQRNHCGNDLERDEVSLYLDREVISGNQGRIIQQAQRIWYKLKYGKPRRRSCHRPRIDKGVPRPKQKARLAPAEAAGAIPVCEIAWQRAARTRLRKSLLKGGEVQPQGPMLWTQAHAKEEGFQKAKLKRSLLEAGLEGRLLDVEILKEGAEADIAHFRKGRAEASKKAKQADIRKDRINLIRQESDQRAALLKSFRGAVCTIVTDKDDQTLLQSIHALAMKVEEGLPLRATVIVSDSPDLSSRLLWLASLRAELSLQIARVVSVCCQGML